MKKIALGIVFLADDVIFGNTSSNQSWQIKMIILLFFTFIFVVVSVVENSNANINIQCTESFESQALNLQI